MSAAPSRHGPRPRLLAWPAAVLLGLAGLSACGDDSGGGEAGLDIRGVQETFDRGDGESVTGETATLSGYVKDVISPWAFTIGGDEFSDVEPLLVVEKDLPAPDQDELVRVTGTLHAFDFSEVQNDLNVDLAETLYEKFEGEPYIKAEKIDENVSE
ncbi:hypothetical protein ACFU46_02845 [Streptomyces griseoincarnatus]